MPVLDRSYVFASHIGHTGKTTLCFQLASAYAAINPTHKVLVIDFAEEGDLSKRFLGGVDNAKQTDTALGKIFHLLDAASSKNMTSWIYSPSIDVIKSAIQVKEFNKYIPENVYLVSSGAMPHAEPEQTSEWRQEVVGRIRSGLHKDSESWKIFCDTDGDRRPSSFTRIAYALCDTAVVPLHLNKGDLDRTETMLSFLYDYRLKKECDTQITLVVWNLVKSVKDQPMEVDGKMLPFTPSKVSLDILKTCNSRLFEMSQRMPGLFIHENDEFAKNSTAIIRNFADNVLKPSEEQGMPFVTMVKELEAGKNKNQISFSTEGTTYQAQRDTVLGADAAVEELRLKLMAMEITNEL